MRQHAVEFDLSYDAPAAFVMEPAAFDLHLWEQATGFVSHTAVVKAFPGPFPFLADPDYPGRSQQRVSPRFHSVPERQ